jgi:hypothetical protein
VSVVVLYCGLCMLFGLTVSVKDVQNEGWNLYVVFNDFYCFLIFVSHLLLFNFSHFSLSNIDSAFWQSWGNKCGCDPLVLIHVKIDIDKKLVGNLRYENCALGSQVRELLGIIIEWNRWAFVLVLTSSCI